MALSVCYKGGEEVAPKNDMKSFDSAEDIYELLCSVLGVVSKVYLRQVLEGVRHIHGQRVVHRDLKPENILLDDQLNVKITDFGFARVLSDGEKLFELCGTPGYLAPETLKANMFEDAPGYGREVDLWACGVIMFTLLVGCPPFWHRKQMVMLRNIMEGRYSFTSPEWADISEDPKDLIRRFLVVEPSERVSIEEALRHPFFNTVLWEQDMAPLKQSLAAAGRKMSRVEELALAIKSGGFNARAKLRLCLVAVRACVRLRRLPHACARAVPLDLAARSPYAARALRKVIDGCAFRVYGHWVKKGEGQNRAALFENTPKTELKSLYVTNLSR